MRVVVKHTMAFAVLIATASACASQAQTRRYQDETATHTGCVPEKIRIADAHETHWTAVCSGRTYFCSKATRSATEPAPPGDEGDQVSCAAVK